MTKPSAVTHLLFGTMLLFGGTACVHADDGIFPAAPAAKAAIDFDGRGFLIHGKRTPIISAGMEYARVPRALWRDRLLRLKRAGFNCVEMYNFWDYHEPQEGKFDFSGDHDLDAYLKLVHEMGLYAICRVGPYYCAEWDSGGYPVWLRFKHDARVRTDSSAFLAAMDPFWDKLLPIVAANQTNRGGAVVLVQLENEHLAGGGRDIPNAYFAHLKEKAVALGIEVPYFFSGLHHGGDPAGNRSWDSVGRTNPWMTTEFWSVNFDRYGARPEDADVYERRTWKVLAFGGNGYNIYMAHGGTNFGYTNNSEDAASYDYASAVGQAGDLRPTYYRFKRIGYFSRSFPELVENTVNADGDFQNVATDPAIHVTARRSPTGNIVFLDNPSNRTVKTQIKSPDGEALPSAGSITLRPGGILPVVEGTPLTPNITLAVGATPILGTTNQGGMTTLVVYGTPGNPGQLRFTAPTDAKTQGLASSWTHTAAGQYDLALSYPTDRPAEYQLTIGSEAVRILAMSDTLADHTWFIPVGKETVIVCGPGYVGDAAVTGGQLRLTIERGLSAPNGISPDPYAESSLGLVYGLGFEGTPLIAQTASSTLVTAPQLSGWQTQSVTESSPNYADANWFATSAPQEMGADGDASAYAWYRTHLHVSGGGSYHMTFKDANDRIIPFLDGARVPDADVHHSTVELSLTPGDHSVAFLATHYGRDKLFGYTGTLDAVDTKGIAGPAHLRVSDGAGVAVTDWRMTNIANNRGALPAADAPGWTSTKTGDDVFHGARGFVWFQTTLPADNSGKSHVLNFSNVDDNATVFLDGKQVAHHEGWKDSFSVPLDSTLGNGKPVVLSVLVQNGDGGGGITGPVTLFSYLSDTPVVGWKMRGGVETGLSAKAWKPLTSATVLDGSPHYFRAQFTTNPPETFGGHPILRLVTGPLSAGFVWLNGHNLGRYPEKIPVNGLYLPESWLQRGENTLVIFDEDGKRPDGVVLSVETVASRDVVELTTQ